MTLGPLEYTVIGFQGNDFDGSIADEIHRVVDAGVIALVDVVFVTKDVDGSVAALELDGKDDPRFASFTWMLQGSMGLLTQDDVENIAADLPTDTSALILLFEHRWAVRIKQAIGDAGGVLISRETIAPEALEMLNAELEAQSAALAA
jgi:hypothetical protein